LASSQVL